MQKQLFIKYFSIFIKYSKFKISICTLSDMHLPVMCTNRHSSYASVALLQWFWTECVKTHHALTVECGGMGWRGEGSGQEAAGWVRTWGWRGGWGQSGCVILVENLNFYTKWYALTAWMHQTPWFLYIGRTDLIIQNWVSEAHIMHSPDKGGSRMAQWGEGPWGRGWGKDRVGGWEQ